MSGPRPVWGGAPRSGHVPPRTVSPPQDAWATPRALPAPRSLALRPAKSTCRPRQHTCEGLHCGLQTLLYPPWLTRVIAAHPSPQGSPPPGQPEEQEGARQAGIPTPHPLDLDSGSPACPPGVWRQLPGGLASLFRQKRSPVPSPAATPTFPSTPRPGPASWGLSPGWPFYC